MGWFGGSSSSSAQQTTSQQTTVSGASASYSPTVASGGGNVLITDEGATKAALTDMTNVVNSVLNEQSGLDTQTLNELSDFNANQSAAQVQQGQDEMSLLSSVLANNQTLAQNVQSGGATTGMDLTTKVVIGALCLMGLIVAMLLFRK